MTASGVSASFWDDTATRWVNDDQRVEAIGGRLGRLAMDALDLGSAERILDVGCGTGETTVELAQRTAPPGSVVGIDLSETMLDTARQRTSSPSVTFVHADAQDLAFVPGSFDRVFSRFGVMFFREPRTAFANLRRALGDDGRLVFVAWLAPDDNDWMRLPAEAASSVIGTPIRFPSTDEPGPFSLAEPERIRTLLESAGFATPSIRSEKDHLAFAASDALAFASGTMSHGGIRAALDHVDTDTELRVQHAIAERLSSRAEDGVIRLTRGANLVVATPA